MLPNTARSLIAGFLAAIIFPATPSFGQYDAEAHDEYRRTKAALESFAKRIGELRSLGPLAAATIAAKECGLPSSRQGEIEDGGAAVRAGRWPAPGSPWSFEEARRVFADPRYRLPISQDLLLRGERIGFYRMMGSVGYFNLNGQAVPDQPGFPSTMTSETLKFSSRDGFNAIQNGVFARFAPARVTPAGTVEMQLGEKSLECVLLRAGLLCHVVHVQNGHFQSEHFKAYSPAPDPGLIGAID